jgi:AcrR family transcriptional regulator
VPRILGANITEHKKIVLDRLYAAFGELLVEQSFAAITLTGVADRAGVSRTTVYGYFDDKETILLEYVRHQTATHLTALEAALAEHADDPVGQLRRYCRMQAELVHPWHLPSGADLVSMLQRDTAARLREHIMLLAAVLRRILEDGGRLGLPLPRSIDTTISLINASLTGRELPASPADREPVLQDIENYVLQAVGWAPRAGKGEDEPRRPIWAASGRGAS